MEAAIAAAVIGMLLLGAVILSVRRWRAGAAEKVSFAGAGPLLTTKERQFFEAVRQALAPECEVLAKVSLADVVRPSPASSALLRDKALQRLRKEHVDFVLYRPDNGQVLGVIDLDSSEPGHHEDRAFFDAALDAVGLPILRIEARPQYDVLVLRQQALATFSPPTPVETSRASTPAAKVRSIVRRGTVWLRVEGNGTFQNSALLRVYTEQMFEEGHRSFAFDLHECEMMDSTFLGTLTGLALRLREDPRGRVGFARVNAKVESLFGRYGLDRVLVFQGFEAAPPAPEEMEELDLLTTKEFKRGTVVEAHEALAASSPENEERFREALDFLKRKEPE
jgi:anti-anti-sigma regulatory factor